jgi:hypothetical protein
MLTAEELLAGSTLTFEVAIPPELLSPAGRAGPTGEGVPAGEAGAAGAAGVAVAAGTGARGELGVVRLRPLTVADLQVVLRAARESDGMVAALMVQRALVEPELTVMQVARLHVGLLEFLLGEVNRVSGIRTTEGELRSAVEAPLARAAHVLAREFGWTLPQVSELTLGQILVHLQMLQQEATT